MRYQLMNSEFSQENNELSAIERVLTNRGIPLENVEHYLNTTDNDIISPLQLNNMHEGAIMLIKHIKQNSPVFIQVD